MKEVVLSPLSQERSRCLLLTASAAFALCAWPSAQTWTGGWPQSGAINAEHHYRVPNSFSGVFRRMEAGDVTGDLVPDGLMQVGSELVIMQKIGAYEHYVDNAGWPAVVDFAVRGAGNPSGADSVLLVNTSGLFEMTVDWDAVNSEYATTFTTLASGGGWANVENLVVKDLGGLPSDDLIGLDGSDSKTFHIAVSNASGALVAFPSFTVPNVVLQFACLDWTGDGFCEVAALTTAGLEIYNWAGTLQVSYPSSHADDRIGVFEESGTERLAWVRTRPSGNQDLYVVDPVGGVQLAAALGPMGVQSIDAADLDLDGYDELLVTQRSVAKAVLLVNQTTLTAYEYDPLDGSKTKLLDLPGDPSTNELSHAAFADVVGDGFADIVVPSDDSTQTDREVVMARGKTILDTSAQATVYLGGPELTAPTQGNPLLHYSFSADLPAAPSVPGANAVKLLAFKYLPDDQTVDQASDVNCAASPTFTGGNPGEVSTGFDLTESSTASIDKIYWTELRVIKLNAGSGGGGIVDKKGPAYPGGLWLGSGPLPTALTEDNPYDGIEVYDAAGNGATVGTFLPVTRIKAFGGEAPFLQHPNVVTECSQS